MENTKQQIDFVEFPKIGRLSREISVTEKLDGTNASIYIGEAGEFLIGSRTKWITPADDNYGFARWATEHKEELVKLGPGRHFGEWWGSGIQRGYGLQKGEKRFSLFNTIRWCLHGTEPLQFPTPDPRVFKTQEVLPACVGLVPVLWKGMFDTAEIDRVLRELELHGSMAAPGFFPAEGLVTFHTGANMCFKKTILKDEVPKSKQ